MDNENGEKIEVYQIMGKWVGGGLEAVIMNYYENMDRNKIHFNFVCDEDSTNLPYKEIEKLGGNVIIVPPYQKVFKYVRELKRIFKENNCKIVHSNLNTLSVFPLYAAKKTGVPIRIAHSHSTSNKKEWKKNLIKNILRPFSKKYANVYFACSELAGRYLFGNKTFDEGKVTVFNNAIDLDKFKFSQEKREQIRKKLNISDDTFVVGHVGRFVAQKNHTFLIDIFNELHKINNNSVLLLIGEGPLQDEIKEKVSKLGLTDSVKFIGQINNTNDYYNSMDVLVLPSLYEGLPVVGVEAQANGLLCEFSSAMTKETKVLKTTRFIDLEKTPEDWANFILNDYKNFKRVDSEKEMTEKKFNIKIEAGKLEKEYISLIDGSK